METTNEEKKPNELALLDERELGLKTMRDEFANLSINGIEDREGFEKVSRARKTLKAERVLIEKDAKKLREGALAFSRRVSTREEELIAIIEPLEKDLLAKEKAIEAEKERIRQEEEKAEAARVQARIDKLASFNYAIDVFEAKNIDDDAFNELLASAEADFNKQKELEERLAREREEEDKRLAEIKAKIEADKELARQQKEAELKAEAERLAAVKEEQDRKEKELRDKMDQLEREREESERKLREREEAEQRERDEKQAELDRIAREREEQLRLDREKFEKEKRDHEEKIRKEQEEKDRVERERLEAIAAEEKAKKDEEERIAREKAEAERKAKLAPDREKLLTMADDIKAFIHSITLSFESADAQFIFTDTINGLNEVLDDVPNRIKEKNF